MARAKPRPVAAVVNASLYRRQRGYFRQVYETGKPTPWPSTEPTPHVVRVARRLQRRVGGGRVLDLGCGEGRHTLLFAGRGFTAVGLDYLERPLRTAADRAREARLAGRVWLVMGDALLAPFKAATFDVVVDYGCFHHVRKADWSIYLDRVIGLVKPGGYFHLTVFSTKFKHYPGERRTRNWHVHRNHYDRFFVRREFPGIFGARCEILGIEEEHEGLNGFHHVLVRKPSGSPPAADEAGR
jgi:SAM-dependent methyltransferase